MNHGYGAMEFPDSHAVNRLSFSGTSNMKPTEHLPGWKIFRSHRSIYMKSYGLSGLRSYLLYYKKNDPGC